MNYEPICNVDEDCLNSCSPIALLQGTHDSYHVKYDRYLIFAKNDYHMTRQFFVKCVCRYDLPATKAFKMIEQVKITGSERLCAPDLVEKKLFIKLLDIDCDWTVENMYQDVEL